MKESVLVKKSGSVCIEAMGDEFNPAGSATCERELYVRQKHSCHYYLGYTRVLSSLRDLNELRHLSGAFNVRGKRSDDDYYRGSAMSRNMFSIASA